MNKKTGIYGGSFNPIHIGHLALANYLCEFGGLDELWFLVSPQNPLKTEQELIPDALRMHWVEQAIGTYPKFRVCDIEQHLPKPSYTIHTLDALRTRHPDRDFYLVIGGDNWALFDKWREHERLIRENHILIYPRPDSPIDASTLPEHALLIDAPQLEISSSFVRESIRAGKDVSFFLPESIRHEAMAYFRSGLSSAT